MKRTTYEIKSLNCDFKHMSDISFKYKMSNLIYIYFLPFLFHNFDLVCQNFDFLWHNLICHNSDKVKILTSLNYDF